MKTKLIVTLLALGILASPASAHDVTWESAPLLDVPELAAWQTAGVEHWRKTPDVRSVDEACGGLPSVRVVPGTGTAAAWGRAAGTFTIKVRPELPDGDPAAYEIRDLPCAIFFENWWLAENPSGRAPCDAYVHELGHALGLTHEFRGDAGSVMAGGSAPECAAAFPPTVVKCPPKWSQATPAVRRAYERGRIQRARRIYRRWKRAHPLRARQLTAGCG